jgi:release factor glutamine methyltransferase
MDEQSFRSAQVMFRKMRDDPDRPGEFSLLGLDWDLVPDVFGPNYTPVTELFTSWITYPVGGTFLEIGSGAGVTAVMAALAGCRAVTALDIGTAAVENTRRNARRHDVADRVRTLRSDLFDALPPKQKFDCVYWNSDFIEAPHDFVNATDFHFSFFDPGYRTHERFLHQVPAHLEDDGRLLLGFNSLGNVRRLNEICSTVGMQVDQLHADSRTVSVVLDGEPVQRDVEFRLLELRPTHPRKWSSLAV